MSADLTIDVPQRTRAVLGCPMCACVAFVVVLIGLSVFLLPGDAVAGEWLFSPLGAGVPYSYGAQPRLAMNGSGEAALVFAFNGVRVSLRQGGGSFEDPAWGGVLVSEAGIEAAAPDVAIDGRGDVVAVWQQRTSSGEQVYASTKPAGGAFGAPIEVSPNGEESSAPSVAIDGEGRTTVVWLADDGTNEVVQAATAGLGEVFSSPVDLSGNGADASDPKVAMDPGGDTIVSWDRPGTHGSQLEVAVCRVGSPCPTPDAQGDGEILGEDAAAMSDVAVDGSGEALAVWRAPGGGLLSARLSGNASSFATASILADDAGTPSVAMNESGEAVAVWPEGSGVQVVTAAPGGAFGGVVTVPSQVATAAVHVAMDATGGVVLEWEGAREGGLFGREGSTRAHGGTFVKPTGQYTDQTPVEGSTAVASDSAGDMVGVWDNSLQTDMESMVYDAGPQLGGIAGPATGTVGKPMAFSIAAPASVWRPLGSVTWSLGDGVTADGLSVEHTYTEPGTYQVTVTAADTQHGFPYHPPLLPEYVSNSESQIVTVSPASLAGGANASEPMLSSLRIMPSSFVAAPSGPSVISATHRRVSKTGATVQFVLTHSSRVILSIERLTTGVLRANRCQLQRSVATRRHAKRCTLARTVGHIARNGSAGHNSFRFAGRIDNAKLQPGTYLLLARPVGSDQKVKRVVFHVLAH
jgi:PKD domain